MKWSLGLHSLLAASYPTHSCHTSPPKTPIFICHFSKTSFLASCCWKIVSRAFVWHSRLSRIWTLPNISVLLISFTMHRPISQPSQQRYQASPRLVGSFSGVWKGYSWVTCQPLESGGRGDGATAWSHGLRAERWFSGSTLGHYYEKLCGKTAETHYHCLNIL